ncbi:MAG: cation transporting ATPase C-terminal domain-containing protein [Clostridia bacterium]|nr:cation transporting ATPase C-terminal domain-containing protein [Clostridia bacterium]
MAFVTLGLIEMVHSFNVRSEESIFKCGIFKNKYLCMAFILGLVMQVRNCTCSKC